MPATCSATVCPGQDDSGYVIFELYDEEQADLLARKLPFRELIFIRQMLVVTHELKIWK